MLVDHEDTEKHPLQVVVPHRYSVSLIHHSHEGQKCTWG